MRSQLNPLFPKARHAGRPGGQRKSLSWRRLIKERKPDPVFRKLLGRSKAHAQAVVLYNPERLNHDLRALGVSIEGRVNVPPHRWEDANRRAAAPRTLVAWICGDPAPGQRALNKRHG